LLALAPRFPLLGEIFTERNYQPELFIGYCHGFARLNPGELAVLQYLGDIRFYLPREDVVCEPEHSIFLPIVFWRVPVLHPLFLLRYGQRSVA
jgi:hypothetical protein